MVKLTPSFHNHLSAASPLAQALEQLRAQQSELAAGVAQHSLIKPRDGELLGDLGSVKPDASDGAVGSRHLCSADVS